MHTNLVLPWLTRSPRAVAPVRIVDDWSALATLQADWETLYAETADATVFQSWAWFECYAKHFAAGQALRCCVVESEEGTPSGLVPFVVRETPSRFGPVRRLMYPLDNWGTSYGPLGRNTAECLRAAWNALRRQAPDFHVLDLRWMPESHCEHVLGAVGGFGARRDLWSETGTIDLRGGWQKYWKEQTSKWRNNRRRAEQILKRFGRPQDVHFRPELGSEDPRWDLYDACLQIAEASWQGTSDSGNTLNHAPVRDFLRDVHAMAVRSGCLQLSLLKLDGRPVAYSYNLLSRGTIHGFRMGFDPAVRAAGAGTVLLAHTIREAAERGDHTFDLGESPSEYKHLWRTGVLRTYRVRHFRPWSWCRSRLGL